MDRQDKKSEVKMTTRMWIIECVDVPEHIDLSEACVYGKIKGETIQEIITHVELIDPERLRYGIPEMGDKHIVIEDDIVTGLAKLKAGSGCNDVALIIDPHEHRETVEHVMARMPIYDPAQRYSEFGRMMVEWQADLKKARG